MKKLLLAWLMATTMMALIPPFASGQSVTGSYTITASGGTQQIPNSVGGLTATFEEIPSGSPATVSITVQGCMRDTTCDTAADTNTSTSRANRGVNFTKVYNYFLVTASWTGGTSPSVKVNYLITSARNGTGGGGNVDSVFGRTGAVVASGGDYTCAQVTNCPGNFQANAVNLTSQSVVNFQDSNAFNGLTFTFTNPSAGNVKAGFSGLLGPGGIGTLVAGSNGLAASATTDTTSATNISSGTLNAARLPATAALTTNRIDQNNAATTSSQLAGVLSDELSTGGAAKSVFAVSLSGNGTGLATTTGSLVSQNCVKVDASGNFVDAGAACGGVTTINNAAQYSATYYSASGSTNTLSGIAAPTSPASVPQYWTSTNSAGSAAAPAWVLAGVSGRAVSGTSDTLLATDRAGWVTYSSASATAVTLPQAGSAGFTGSFVVGLKATGAGAVTVTPATSLIDGNATLVITRGQNCTITSLDNTDYVSRCASGQLTVGSSNLVATPSANGVSLDVGSSVALLSGANAGAAAFTLNMSASNSASAFRVPNIAGASSTTAGAVSFDTTNKSYHGGANSVDNLFALLPASIVPTDGDCAKFTVTSGVVTLNTAGAACGTAGANAALSNLASVSVNTALLAQTGVDLGSTTKPFRDAYLVGAGTFGTNYFKLTGTPTSTRTLTLPDATDTVVGKATTDTLTNKTFDTAGAGNSFSINGVAATANTGTGSVVRATAPAVTGITTDTIVASGQAKAAGYADTSTGYLTAAMTQQTTATCTNVTNMTWNIAANTKYKLHCDIPITFVASATISTCLGGPGTATSYSLVDYLNLATSTVNQFETINQTAYGTKTTVSTAPGALTRTMHVDAQITNGSTASGTPLTVQTAANGTNGFTVLADSVCELKQIGN